MGRSGPARPCFLPRKRLSRRRSLGILWPNRCIPVCPFRALHIWCRRTHRFILEVDMRTTALVAMLALATVAACAKKAEPVEPAPAVSTEPTYTGKYK